MTLALILQSQSKVGSKYNYTASGKSGINRADDSSLLQVFIQLGLVIILPFRIGSSV